MPGEALILVPAVDGWTIRLTNGVEVEHFRGLAARWRAQRRLAALAAHAES